MTNNEHQGATVDRIIERNTPTDDEREVLANLVQLGFVTDWYEAADRILAAGFRRSEVPEPNISIGYAYREGYESGFRDGELGKWRGDD